MKLDSHSHIVNLLWMVGFEKNESGAIFIKSQAGMYNFVIRIINSQTTSFAEIASVSCVWNRVRRGSQNFESL